MTMRTALPRGRNVHEVRRRLAEAVYGPVPYTGPTDLQRRLYGRFNYERYRLPVEIEGKVFAWISEPRCSICRNPELADALDRAVMVADRLLACRTLSRPLRIPRSQRPRARDCMWTALARSFTESGVSPDAVRRHFTKAHSPVLQVQDWIDQVRRPQLLAEALGL